MDLSYSLHMLPNLELHMNHVYPTQAKGTQQWYAFPPRAVMCQGMFVFCLDHLFSTLKKT